MIQTCILSGEQRSGDLKTGLGEKGSAQNVPRALRDALTCLYSMPKKKKGKKLPPPKLVLLEYGPYMQSGKVLHCFVRLQRLQGFIKELGILLEVVPLEVGSKQDGVVRIRKVTNAMMKDDEETGEPKLMTASEQLEAGNERQLSDIWECANVREFDYDGLGEPFDDACFKLRESFDIWPEEEPVER